MLYSAADSKTSWVFSFTGSPLRRKSTAPPSLRQAGLSGISSADIALQMLDRLFLSGNNRLDKVADGNYSDDLVTLNHRKMANAMLRHDLHAFINCLTR